MDKFQLTVLLKAVRHSPLEIDMKMFATLQDILPYDQLAQVRSAVPYSPWNSNEVREVVMKMLKYTRERVDPFEWYH